MNARQFPDIDTRPPSPFQVQRQLQHSALEIRAVAYRDGYDVGYAAGEAVGRSERRHDDRVHGAWQFMAGVGVCGVLVMAFHGALT